MRSQTLFSRRSRMKKCIIYWKVQWICFALGGWAMILGLRNHYILFCPAGLYINWTLSKQRDYLVRFSKGSLKNFSVAVFEGMHFQTLFSRRSEWSYTIKLRATHITLLVYILFFPRRLGHDTQVTQSSHSILPCGALYKLDPLETKGLNLVRFSKGCVHKHFSVAVVEWKNA